MRSLTRLAAAAVLVSAVSAFPGAPAFAQKVTLDNIVFGSGAVSVRLPRIEFDTPSLPEAELRAIFDPAQSAQVARRLRSLNARVVIIQEVQFEQTIGTGASATKQLVRYGGMALTDVQAGKARFLRMAPSKVEMTDPVAGKMNMELGPVAADDVDFAFLASLITEAGDPNQPKRPIYRNFVLDSFGMNIGQIGNVRMGKMTVGEVRMRPLKKAYTETFALLMGLPPGSPPSGETLRAMLEMYADFFDAYETTASDVTGMDMDFKNAKSNEAVKVNIARMTVAPFQNGVMEGFSVDGIKFDLAGQTPATFNLGAFGVKAIDFRPFTASIAKMGSAPPEQYLMANWREVMPNISGFFLKGMNLDVPDDSSPDGRIKVSLGAFDLSLAKHILGIPTDIGVSTTDLTLDLAAAKKPEFAPMIAMGYNVLRASHQMRLFWDDAAKALKLADRLSMPLVADLALDATLANVPPELFGKDLALMQVAALGVAAKDAKLTISNLGVYEKALGFVAQQQGSNPAALKQQFGGMAQMMLPQILGGSPSVLALSQAIGKFAQNGKTLTVVVTSKNPGGIGLPDAMSIASPQDLLEKVDVQATAD